MEDIVNDVRWHKITKKKGVCELFSLDDQATTYEKKIISSIGAMLMKLPDEYLMNEAKEMQLITRYLDPALESLFDDLDNDIMFKWSNTINQESKTATSISISKRRPDASIDYLQGVYFHKTYGFGEVKCHSDAQSNHGISKDLHRLGVFSKNAIDHGKLKGALSFQAIGKYESRPFFLGIYSLVCF
ncbi:hypothetical protein [Absidia glauca]|uniref:Uncharacterized protein n=1 Tax=Absidia glauca TaxID=4829 RepID=A0A168M059_ABSGL|nr:hypothetical protein [Absidia glauca]